MYDKWWFFSSTSFLTQQRKRERLKLQQSRSKRRAPVMDSRVILLLLFLVFLISKSMMIGKFYAMGPDQLEQRWAYSYFLHYDLSKRDLGFSSVKMLGSVKFSWLNCYMIGADILHSTFTQNIEEKVLWMLPCCSYAIRITQKFYELQCSV